MLKKIQKEVEDLRIKVCYGLSTEDTDKALYKIEQMLFKAMDKQLNIPIVVSTSVCDEPDEPVEKCKCCKSFHEPDLCCYD
jgi:acetone carboxylase gamma subunit